MEKKYLLPDGAYDILKWLGLIACPALAVFYGVLAKTWGLPYGEQVVTTINAVSAFIGTIIGVSHVTAKEAEDAR